MGFDENCSKCMAFSRRLRSFDFLRLLHADSAQNPQANGLNEIALPDRLYSMHAIDENKKIFSGFDAITEAVIRLPLGFMIAPFFRILQFTKIGAWIFSHLILNSKWRKECTHGLCEIKS